MFGKVPQGTTNQEPLQVNFVACSLLYDAGNIKLNPNPRWDYLQ